MYIALDVAIGSRPSVLSPFGGSSSKLLYLCTNTPDDRGSIYRACHSPFGRVRILFDEAAAAAGSPIVHAVLETRTEMLSALEDVLDARLHDARR